jgi:hypothetical protein
MIAAETDTRVLPRIMCSRLAALEPHARTEHAAPTLLVHSRASHRARARGVAGGGARNATPRRRAKPPAPGPENLTPRRLRRTRDTPSSRHHLQPTVVPGQPRDDSAFFRNNGHPGLRPYCVRPSGRIGELLRSSQVSANDRGVQDHEILGRRHAQCVEGTLHTRFGGVSVSSQVPCAMQTIGSCHRDRRRRASSNNGRRNTVSSGEFGGNAGTVPQSLDGSDP